MKTISKIGQAALSRIFKPENGMRGYQTDFERTVEFQKQELSLGKCIFQHEVTRSTHEETIRKTKVQVWGITTGLNDVKIIEDGKSLWGSLWPVHSWENKEYISHMSLSHIIITNSKEYRNFSDRCGSIHEDVLIYRISDKQIHDIRNERNSYCSFPEFETVDEFTFNHMEAPQKEGILQIIEELPVKEGILEIIEEKETKESILGDMILGKTNL